MKILIMGAGAMGSLFGALLSKDHKVILIGRKTHIEEINKKGLYIDGLTKIHLKINAESNINNINFLPDLIILTVKSYDTTEALNKLIPIISNSTFILSLQNGLDNIEKILKVVKKNRVIAGVTTQGALFSDPGKITHTGKGKTIIGAISEGNNEFIEDLIDHFNKSGIETNYSNKIIDEIWKKAIINSSINPLTTMFNCKNGYLLENPIIEKIVEKICYESTIIANSFGIKTSFDDMIMKTKEVIKKTADNSSSMLQSYKKYKKTEIDSINKILIKIGEKNNCPIVLNETLLRIIDLMTS